MRKTNFLGLLAIPTLLLGCAKSPDSIAPVSMGNAFVETSCADAITMLNAERPILAALEQKQRDAVAGDAIGVFLVLIPVSSLTGGNVEGDIAASKGKVLALEARTSSC